MLNVYVQSLASLVKRSLLVVVACESLGSKFFTWALGAPWALGPTWVSDPLGARPWRLSAGSRLVEGSFEKLDCDLLSVEMLRFESFESFVF